MIQYCPRHRIGYNDDLDPQCPQCALAHMDAPQPLDVDQNTLEVKGIKDPLGNAVSLRNRK